MVPTIVLYIYIYLSLSLSLLVTPSAYTGMSSGREEQRLVTYGHVARHWLAIWSSRVSLKQNVRLSSDHLIISTFLYLAILQLDLTQPHGPWRTMAFFSFDLQGTKTSWWHRAQGVSGFFSCAKMVPEFWGYDETDPFLVDNKFATICKLRPGSLVLRKKFSVFFFKFEHQVPMMKCCMSDSLDSLCDCIQWPSCSPRYLSLALESFVPI